MTSSPDSLRELAFRQYGSLLEPLRDSLEQHVAQWERERQEAARVTEALRELDPEWLEKLARWLDEDDRLMREQFTLGNFVNRDTGEPMDPETQRLMVEHRSDDGTQQQLRSYASLIRQALQPVEEG